MPIPTAPLAVFFMLAIIPFSWGICKKVSQKASQYTQGKHGGGGSVHRHGRNNAALCVCMHVHMRGIWMAPDIWEYTVDPLSLATMSLFCPAITF